MAAKNRITVSLEDKEYQELAKLSQELDRSLSWIMRQATRSFLEKRIYSEANNHKIEKNKGF